MLRLDVASGRVRPEFRQLESWGKDRSKAQLQSELEIAWAEGAPSLSEFRAIQTIVIAGADILRAQLEVGVVENVECLGAEL